MAVTTLYGSRIMTGLVATPAELGDPGEAGGVKKAWTETVESGAADSTTSVYYLATLPSNARILPSSRIGHDALGATTCALDIGVYNDVGRSDITADPDAINDGIVASTAGTKDFIKDPANWGKRLWEFVNGQTVDPKCLLRVGVALTDAHLSSGAGTVSVQIDYSN